MRAIKQQIEELFVALDRRVEDLNSERRAEGLLGLPKSKVRLLGQMSLLSNERVSLILSLAQTGDLDALLTMDSVVKDELKSLLKQHGLVYDEDSYLIWIPPGAKFEKRLDLSNVLVESIDPESALVSKAVKAPKKNIKLIRQAIASNRFPHLAKRILENGGNLEVFA